MVFDKSTFDSKIDLNYFKEHFINTDNYKNLLLFNDHLKSTLLGSTTYDKYYNKYFNTKKITYYYDILSKKTIENGKNNITNLTFDLDLSYISSNTAIKYMLYLDILSSFYNNLAIIKESTLVDKASIRNHHFDIPINYIFEREKEEKGILFNSQNISDTCNDISLKFYLENIYLDFKEKKLYDYFVEEDGKNAYIEKKNSSCDFNLDNIKNLFNQFEFNNFFNIDQDISYYHYETYKYEYKFYKLILNYHILSSYYNIINNLDNNSYRSIKLQEIKDLFKKFKKIFYNFNKKFLKIKQIVNSIETIPMKSKKEQIIEGKEILDTINILNDKIQHNNDDKQHIHSYYKSKENSNELNKKLLIISIFILIITVFIYMFNDVLYKNRNTKVFIAIVYLIILFSLNYFIFNKKIYESLTENLTENLTEKFTDITEDPYNYISEIDVEYKNFDNTSFTDFEFLKEKIRNQDEISNSYVNPYKWIKKDDITDENILLIKKNTGESTDIISFFDNKYKDNPQELILKPSEYNQIKKNGIYINIIEKNSDKDDIKYILQHHYFMHRDEKYTPDLMKKPEDYSEKNEVIAYNFDTIDSKINDFISSIKYEDEDADELKNMINALTDLSSEINKEKENKKGIDSLVKNIKDINNKKNEFDTYTNHLNGSKTHLQNKLDLYTDIEDDLKKHRNAYKEKVEELEYDRYTKNKKYDEINGILDEYIKKLDDLISNDITKIEKAELNSQKKRLEKIESELKNYIEKQIEENASYDYRTSEEKTTQSALLIKLYSYSESLINQLIATQKLEDEIIKKTDTESIQLKHYIQRSNKLKEEIRKEKLYFEATLNILKKKYSILEKKNAKEGEHLIKIRDRNANPIEITLYFSFSSDVIKFIDKENDLDENKKLFIDYLKLDFDELFKYKNIKLDNLDFNYNDLIIIDDGEPYIKLKLYSSYKLKEEEEDTLEKIIIDTIIEELNKPDNVNDLIYIKYIEKLSLEYDENFYPEIKLKHPSKKEYKYDNEDYNEVKLENLKFDNKQLINNIMILINDIKDVEISKNSYYNEINPYLKIEKDSIKDNVDDINKEYKLYDSNLNLIEMDTIDYNNLNKLLIYISIIFTIIIMFNNIFNNSIVFKIILIITIIFLIFIYFMNKLKIVRTNWRYKYWKKPKDVIYNINNSDED